eukprot:TRINITY_DN13038_c0_g1_i1.p1 TRINITY_DN13038_c0_g1~~TRINITY_DN13038_c0_g1_i1.p1  ORF type:complete len:367 (-),score=93.52 TRINITY_DN13038_c0_g1_i1:31-1131(-)
MKFELLLLIILLNIAFAKIWYVSNNGNDKNNGTEQSPFASISKAVSVANNLDSISLSKGVFNGYNINIGKTLSIYGQNPQQTSISCAEDKMKRNGYSGLSFPNGGSLSNVMLENCEPAVFVGTCNSDSNQKMLIEDVVFYNNMGSVMIDGMDTTINRSNFTSGGLGIQPINSCNSKKITNINVFETDFFQQSNSIYCTGPNIYVSVNESKFFSDYTATYGTNGAISSNQCSFTIVGSSFTNITSSQDGAAIFLISSVCNITSSSFIGNMATMKGGSIYVGNSSTCYVQGCQLQQNFCSNDGGAIYCGKGSLFINQSVIVHNSANAGGAVFCSNECKFEMFESSVQDNQNSSGNNGGCPGISKEILN